MNSFNISKPIDVRSLCSNIDKLYGPYNSIHEACLAIPINRRKIGRTVGIIHNNVINEYWWGAGILDQNLVVKCDFENLTESIREAYAAAEYATQSSVFANESATNANNKASLADIAATNATTAASKADEVAENIEIVVDSTTTSMPLTPAHVEGTWDDTNHKLHLEFEIPKGAKGDQGNTGSSIDYPFELVNNLETDDSTKGLSAAMGKVLYEREVWLTEDEYFEMEEAGILDPEKIYCTYEE